MVSTLSLPSDPFDSFSCALGHGLPVCDAPLTSALFDMGPSPPAARYYTICRACDDLAIVLVPPRPSLTEFGMRCV